MRAHTNDKNQKQQNYYQNLDCLNMRLLFQNIHKKKITAKAVKKFKN